MSFCLQLICLLLVCASAFGHVRLNEQLAWEYDKSGNLQYRTNNALAQAFWSDRANELTNITRTGTLTVSGATPVPASGVGVNGQPAERYDDFTFASAGHGLSGNDTFTIVATNAYGLRVTNTLNTSLPVSVNLSYDLNGNMTSDGSQWFGYDGWNRLATNWVAGQWKVEHVYDGLSRRRISRDYRWDAGTGWVKTNETRYVYDGMLPIQERDETNGVRVSYVRGMDLSGSLHGAGGIGGLLARQDHSTFNPQLSTAYYHSDGAGNITTLSDAQEGIAARYLYEPFGRLIGQWGPLADANAMRFSSKPRISPGGDLYDYGFRIYTTRLQRWTSRDPLGEAGGINLYGFVGNSPLNRVDPLGLDYILSTGIRPASSFNYPDIGGPTLGETASQVGSSWLDNLVNSLIGIIGMTMRDPTGDPRAQQQLNAIVQNAHEQLGSPMAQNGFYQPGSQEDVVGTGLFILTPLPLLKGKPCPGKMPFRPIDFVRTDKMSPKDFATLLADIRKNGLQNPVIEYTVIGDTPYVLRGSNRLQAAGELGIQDQLIFQQVQLPFLGYQNEMSVIESAVQVYGGGH